MNIVDGSQIYVITEFGVYCGIDNARYHEQCTDTPSVSSAMLKSLTDYCSTALWHASYLNPNRALLGPAFLAELKAVIGSADASKTVTSVTASENARLDNPFGSNVVA